MTVNYFNLPRLFEQAFGYRTPAFNPEFAPVTGHADPVRQTAGAYGSPYYGTDAMNREYYLPVTLAYEQDGVHQEWELPYPVVSLSAKKNIRETTLTGRRGTVKELSTVEDYVIDIKGLILQQANELPEQMIGNLCAYFEYEQPLSIKSVLTDIFLLRPGRAGSDKVVITELKFPALPGVKHVRPYELKLLSEEPFNLIYVP